MTAGTREGGSTAAIYEINNVIPSNIDATGAAIDWVAFIAYTFAKSACLSRHNTGPCPWILRWAMSKLLLNFVQHPTSSPVL